MPQRFDSQSKMVIDEELIKLRAELKELSQENEKLRLDLAHRDSILELAPNFAVYRVVMEPDYHINGTPHARAVAYVSPNFSEITGVGDPSDPQNWFKSMHPDDIEHVLQAQANMPDTGHFDVTMRAFHDRKGEWRWLRAISQMFYEPDGSPKYVNGLVMDITDQTVTKNRLLAYQKNLRSLNDQILSTEERERRRVAEVLHDDVGQDLALALFKMNQAAEKQGDLGPLLDEIFPLIEQAISYTRSLTKELCPPALCQMGLVSGLQWLADRLEEQYQVLTTFNTKGDFQDIEGDLSSIIYRITAELINNVAKHGQATNTKLELLRQKGNVSVRVEDDGVGFEYSPEALHTSDGFGLFMVTERLRSLGGTLEIDSKPGQGTRVWVEIPLIQ